MKPTISIGLGVYPKMTFGDLNIGDTFQSIPEEGGERHVWIKIGKAAWTENGILLSTGQKGGFEDSIPVRLVKCHINAEVQQ